MSNVNLIVKKYYILGAKLENLNFILNVHRIKQIKF